MPIEDLWQSRAVSAAIYRTVLTPASWFYAFGWEAYASSYRLGFKRPTEAHRPVVCIGNLVVGGSGKTPATLAIARILKDLDKTVVLSMSGYGSPRSEAASLVPDGSLLAAEWGDEPAMVRWLIPDLPLIVGRRRVLAAELASRHFPTAVLLMDDGFQHLPIRKHVSIVLDADQPPNSKCLPAGPYREPRRNRAKADLILGEGFKLVRSSLRFVDPEGAGAKAPTAAAMLSAIANPDSFAESLADAGVNVREQVRKPDHDPLTAGNLFHGLDRNTALVVTAKDWVKLRARSDLSGRNILIALQNADIEPAVEFRTWISERLAQVRAN